MSTLQYCFWETKSLEDTYIMITKQSLTILIFLYSFFRICQIYRLKNYNKSYSSDRARTLFIVYLLIFTWAVIQNVQNLYAIFIYYMQIQQYETPSQMINFSRNYTILDSFPGFIIQSLFIVICYIYCKNIQNNIQIQIFKKHELKLRQIMKYYMYLRVFCKFAAIVGVIMSSNQDLFIAHFISLLVIIVDAFIVNVFLMLSYKWYLIKIQRQISQIKRQYILMMVTSILRIIIDVIFLLLPSATQEYCVEPFHKHWTFSIGYIAFGSVVNHFLPILVFFYIYNYNLKENKNILNSSLIESKR